MDLRNFFDEIGFRVARVSKEGRYNIYCPLHVDTLPSLFIFPTENTYKCFGSCNLKGWGIGKFFREVDPKEGIKWEQQLAALIPYVVTTSFLAPKKEIYNTDIDIEALSYASSSLEYLEKRNIKEETIKRFSIKYHKYYNALIVPLTQRGQNVGYVRRNLTGSPKYQNSDNSIISSYLYPIDFLDMGENDNIILVEGLFDVIKAHQMGYTNCLSNLGGALTEAQVRKLGEYTHSVTLCPDKDQQGLRIAEQSSALLLKYGYNLSYASLRGGKDFAEGTIKEQLSYFRLKFSRTSLKDFIKQ
jgi:DNA primase